MKEYKHETNKQIKQFSLHRKKHLQTESNFVRKDVSFDARQQSARKKHRNLSGENIFS